MKRWIWFMAAALVLTGCLFGLGQTAKIPRPGGNNGELLVRVAPDMIFNYHGSKAGLDARGGGKAAVGLDLSRYAGITDIGVPMNSHGTFRAEQGGRDYIQEMRDSLGATTIRTIETWFDPGRPGNMWGQVNFGAVLLGYTGIGNPGEFIGAWSDSLMAPCDGVAFDIEYPIMNRELYPVTQEDQAIAGIWGLDLTDRDQYIAFRCREIATIFRLMFQEAILKYPRCNVAIAYSAYPGLSLGAEGDVRATYGCDFELMTDRELEWRRERLPAITHGHMAWHTTVELPPGARAWIKNAPIRVLHNIQLAPALESEQNFSGQIADRLSLLRPDAGDGLGLVGLGELWKFDGPDSSICRILGEELHSRHFIQ